MSKRSRLADAKRTRLVRIAAIVSLGIFSVFMAGSILVVAYAVAYGN